MKIFNKGHFEEIKINKEEILVISKDIKLTEDEKAVLRLHNKFSIIQYLDEKEQEFEQEQAYTKVRMQRKKEMEEMEKEGERRRYE